MDCTTIRTIADNFIASPANQIDPAVALTKELANVRIFAAPLMGVAIASNPLFTEFQQDSAVGPQFLLPQQWLVEALTVISFFFPFSKTIRDSNKQEAKLPSSGWLHGRIEGQDALWTFGRQLTAALTAAGFKAVLPGLDKRFAFDNKTRFTSNWSERHVAYICGLGTFSLSKGLITEKGVAGRYISIVTNLEIPPTPVAHKRFDENCIMCGQCIKNCPAHAISLEHGKNHQLCAAYLQKMRAAFTPRYGCGKCQIGVPCEACNPAAATVANAGV